VTGKRQGLQGPGNVVAAARRLTGARFVCRLKGDSGAWSIAETSGLNRVSRAELVAALESATAQRALSRALRKRESVAAPAALRLCGEPARIFPDRSPGGKSLLLVGVPPPGLKTAASLVFAALATSLDGDAVAVESAQPVALPAMDLDAALAQFTAALSCDASDLAVRWGDRFRVAAVRGYPEGWLGEERLLSDSPLESRLVRTRRAVLLGPRQAHAKLPFPGSFRARSWLGVPLVVGERVIGRVGMARRAADGFDAEVVAAAERRAGEIAPVVEGILLFQEATRRLARLAVVQEVAPLGATLGEPDRIIARVLSILRRSFSPSWVSYLAPGAPGQPAEVRWGVEEGGLARDGGRADGSLFSRLAKDVDRDRPRVIRADRGWLHPQAVVSLAAPVRFGERLLGFLVLETARLNAYGEDDERLLTIIAGQVASFLENARLYHEMGVAVEQLSAIRQTALDLASQVDHPEVLDNLAERVQLLLRVPCVELGLVDSDAGGIRILVSRNPWKRFEGETIRLGEGLEGRAASEGKAMVEPASQWWIDRGMGRRRRGRAACLPLRWGEEVIGVLSVLDDDPQRTFSMEDMRLLELLAPQAAITLRNARLLQDLREQIDERKRTEAQLVQSAKMAAVGQMAAGVAHEINNPLTTVAGFTELWLEEMGLENPMRAELEMVTKETRRAREVVSRLLDFARQRSPIKERVGLNEVVRESLDLVRHYLALHGVELRERYAGELPWVEIERGGVKQVLLNLAHNAVQAMPEGGVLTVETGAEARARGQGVYVLVADTGAGIAEENLRHLFEPFFTTKAPGQGTGLGLALSYGIIAEHGGDISVDSRPGEGAHFRVWLPLAQGLAV